MFIWGKARKLYWLLLICIGVLMMTQGCGRKEDSVAQPAAPSHVVQKQLEELNRTADELYRLATTGEYVKSREALTRFGEQAAAASYAGATGVEGVDALFDAVVDAKRQFNAVRPDPAGMVKASARLKLAADALTHPKQPMWLQYGQLLRKDTEQLALSVDKGDKKEASAQFVKLKDHYETIRPAVWISRSPEEGEKMDSLLVFLGKYTGADSLEQEVLSAGIKQWQEALDALFSGDEDHTAYMPFVEPDEPILWTVTIGSLIVGVLGFSAWRMLQWERSRMRVPRPRRAEGKE
ncbi:MAG: hypothetical protein K0R57_3322 [Paenibacillaceae bacterium]|jgi:sporulation protein YpjB|nr:hypothetical protein [Paenibacillaceae bacterium]